MHQILRDKINQCESGSIYATVVAGESVTLVRLGSYSEVRHRFNQVVCLLGALVKLNLAASPTAALHSRSAPLGTWILRLEGGPTGDADQLFQLASRGPSAEADCVGYQAFNGDWPVGMLAHLSGFKAMAKSLTEISNVFYGSRFKPAAQIGQSQDVSAVKRAKEALVWAKRRGHCVYEEAELAKFLNTLTTARFLHFFHQV